MSDAGPWYFAVRDPGEPPIKPFVPLSRDVVHELRRNDLRAALARDVMRRDFGYRSQRFRDTLRALLTPDERAPRP